MPVHQTGTKYCEACEGEEVQVLILAEVEARTTHETDPHQVLPALLFICFNINDKVSQEI